MGLGEDAKTEIKIHISKVVIKKINDLLPENLETLFKI